MKLIWLPGYVCRFFSENGNYVSCWRLKPLTQKQTWDMFSVFKIVSLAFTWFLAFFKTTSSTTFVGTVRLSCGKEKPFHLTLVIKKTFLCVLHEGWQVNLWRLGRDTLGLSFRGYQIMMERPLNKEKDSCATCNKAIRQSVCLLCIYLLLNKAQSDEPCYLHGATHWKLPMVPWFLSTTWRVSVTTQSRFWCWLFPIASCHVCSSSFGTARSCLCFCACARHNVHWIWRWSGWEVRWRVDVWSTVRRIDKLIALVQDLNTKETECTA